jgi:hypothetical protein
MAKKSLKLEKSSNPTMSQEDISALVEKRPKRFLRRAAVNQITTYRTGWRQRRS